MKDNKTLTYILIIIGVAVLLAVGLSFLNKADNGSTEYNAVASCIADSGAKFYGAFWCPHCAEQKRNFGGSQKLLPYIECSTPNTQGQLQVCVDAGIESYPTWEFANGERISQVMTPERLAELTGCEASLPGASASTTEAI